jgi:phosphoribosylformylglycinamidine synthase
MSHPNVASKEPIVRQYDHTVQGTSALPPFGGAEGDAPSDAAVMAPILGKPYGLVIAHGLNPVLNTLDAYWGSVWAAAEAVSNLVAVGGNHREIGLIDNFIWPKPDEPSLGELDRAVDACIDVMHSLKRPFISGKDSLSSTYRFPDGTVLKIPPVLCVSVFGRIPDVTRTVSSDFKRVGSRLVLVGRRDVAKEAGHGMGGSVYLESRGETGMMPPRVDLEALPSTFDAVYAAIDGGQVRACHDISEGGLLAALAEMGFGGDMGAEVDLVGLVGAGGAAERADVLLFNETAGVFVVELGEGADPEVLFAGVDWVDIGRTVAEPSITVRDGDAPVFEVELSELQAAWEAPMRAVFH